MILYKVEYVCTPHSTYIVCACAVELVHLKQEIKLASEVEYEVEEIPQNKATTVRGKGRKWADAETDQLTDLLEKNFCL